jgi:lipid-A-disaccharide synthase
MANKNPTIALVAGEASGDQLGAALIERLKKRYPQARFAGIGGKHMKAAGLDAWWDSEELALFGLVEVLSHLPRLFRLRSELTQRLLDLKPDVFIGIDAPDFNLGLEIKLRKKKIPTVHYVSPTVWAWREKRVRKIGRAADLVLCLFPFEPDFYSKHGVKAVYVGHPMADQIDPSPDPATARSRLGLNASAPVIALLPGSRASEVSRLAEPMILAAKKLSSQQPRPQFVTAMANDKVLALFSETMKRLQFSDIQLVSDDPRTVIAAADVVMSASGTATLETMLVNRPLVVAYRLSATTIFLLKHLRLLKPQHFSLPNILAGETLVPELIQNEVSGESLARETAKWLDNEAARASLEQRFLDIHNDLRCDASMRAAEAVSELLERRAC